NFAKTQRLAACLAAFGFLVDVYYFFIQVFVLKTLCLFCLGTYALCIFYFVTVSWMCESRSRGLLAFFIDPLKGKTTALQMPSNLWWLSGAALASFVAAVGFFPSAIWMQSSFYSYGKRVAEQFFMQWHEKAVHEIQLAENSASMGSPNAP